jgi:GTP-binding protein
MEPSEILTIDIPENFVGTVIERLGPRKGEMVKMANHGSGRVRMEFKVPSRGLIGLRNEMLTETRGTIVMNSIAGDYIPYSGEIPQRPSGALISDRQGVTTMYALDGIQDRGILFLGDGAEVYEGMIIGEHSRDNDLDVNCVREKKLTNMRASGSDDAVRLVPYKATHARAVHRVHRRRRTRRGHPEVPPHAQENPPGQPPPLQGRALQHAGPGLRLRHPTPVHLCQ